MYNDFITNLLHVCKSLNNFSVKYLIVGGSSVSLHGYVRMSKNEQNEVAEKVDLDFLYEPTYENYFNLLKALEELDINIDQLKKEKSPNPRKSFLKFNSKYFKLDLLPEIKGLAKFNDSFKNRQEFSVQDILISTLNYDDLIKSKYALHRPKDLIDIIELKKANRNKS